KERICPPHHCQVFSLVWRADRPRSVPAIYAKKGVMAQVRHYLSHPATRVSVIWTEILYSPALRSWNRSCYRSLVLHAAHHGRHPGTPSTFPLLAQMVFPSGRRRRMYVRHHPQMCGQWPPTGWCCATEEPYTCTQARNEHTQHAYAYLEG